VSIDVRTFQAHYEAEVAAAERRLGGTPAEFDTAGELAALMGRLPPDTKVFVAETVHIDPGLQLEETPNRTTAAATVLRITDPDKEMVEVVVEGQTCRFMQISPAVQLGAYIAAADAPDVPKKTWPFPPHERAAEVMRLGDLAEALHAHVELLTWMAGSLTYTPVYQDASTAPAWVADMELREQLAVEAERLRQTAARLIRLRGRVAANQANEDKE
jgi:hypothetical protein